MTKTLVVALASMMMATNVANATVEHDHCKNSSSCKEKSILLNNLKDNWFIGIGGGIHNYYGNHTRHLPFGKRISPIFNVYAGKWFTPIVGVRTNFAWANTFSADTESDNPLYHSDYKDIYKTKFNELSLNVETMFDMTNLLYGYKKDRVYNFIAYVGAGWVRNCANKVDKATATFGLINKFRLNDKFDLNLDVKASSFGEGLDWTFASKGKKSDLTTSIMIGTTYYFKKRGFDRAKFSDCEIKHMQDKLKDLNAEKDALANQLAAAKANPEIREVVKTKYISSDAAVFFAINKHDLKDKDRVNLGFVANMIKKTDQVFIITGYADKATGSAPYNEKLSAARAKSVYDTLVNEFNVNPNQLEIDHKGGVENMFYDKNYLSRVAIIRMK